LRRHYFSQGRIWSAKHRAYRRFQTHAIAIRNEGGEIFEWYGALVDVQDATQIGLKDIREDLAQTLRALRVSEAKSRTQAEQLRAVSDELSAILNTAGIGITRCSRDLRYLRANETYATIAGLPLGKIIGRHIVEVMGEAAFVRKSCTARQSSRGPCRMRGPEDDRHTPEHKADQSPT
jgi:PAS domain-containing protein